MALQQFVAAAMEKPTGADWLAAWAALVAAIGTIGTFIWQARSLRQERETRKAEIARLEAEQREAQDAQARTVLLHRPGCGTSSGASIRDYNITVYNLGMHPITNITASLMLRATGQDFSDEGPKPVTFLHTDKPLHLKWELGHVPWPADMDTQDLPGLFKCEVQFTDVYGTRWAIRPGIGQQPSRVYGL